MIRFQIATLNVRKIIYLDRLSPLARFRIERNSLNFNVVRSRQPHVVLELVLFKLFSRDAVDDGVLLVVHFDDSDVVTDDHRVGVLWRFPGDVGDGQAFVVLRPVDVRIVVGLKLAGNVVGFWLDRSFHLWKIKVDVKHLVVSRPQ